MSTTDGELGRAIVALQGLRSGAGWGTPGTRRFPDDHIRDLFRITPEKMAKCVAAYDKTRPRRWTLREAAEGILKFAVKHGSWPKREDMESGAWRKNGLPTKDVFHDYFPVTNRAWGSNTPGSSSMDACINHLMGVQKYWKQFTPQMILAIRNVTVRQQAMERYGIQKLLKDMKAKAFQEDEFGKLWRLPSDNRIDKHAQWVEVTNATPEKDGRYLHFFLRVPPTFETAKSAVHWTFPDLEEEGIPPDKFEIAQAS